MKLGRKAGMRHGLSVAVRGLVLALAVASAAFVSPAPAAAATQVGDVKLVKIAPWYNENYAMKAIGDGDGTGTFDHIYIKPWLNTSASKWKMRVHWIGNGYWIVSFQNTYYGDRCLDKKSGVDWEVYLYPCHFQDNQLWRILKVGSGAGADRFQIQNKKYGWYLNESYNGLVSSDPQLRDEYDIYVLG